MGACATKPRELKEEEVAPLPPEEPAEVIDVEAEEKEDDSKRTLGKLFKEGEIKREESESEKEITVKEAIMAEQQETKEEEETKSIVHTAQGSETTEISETKVISAPTPEEASSSLEAPVAKERPVEIEAAEDSIADDIEEVTTVLEKSDTEVVASTMTEKKEDVIETA